MTRRPAALACAAATVVVGVLWRTAPLGLPAFAFKYGGSAMYALMLYCLVVAAFPRARSVSAGLIAEVAACGVECFKLVHAPALDAFRRTLAGKLILGRVFTWGALVAYSVAIALAVTCDHMARRRDGSGA